MATVLPQRQDTTLATISALQQGFAFRDQIESNKLRRSLFGAQTDLARLKARQSGRMFELDSILKEGDIEGQRTDNRIKLETLLSKDIKNIKDLETFNDEVQQASLATSQADAALKQTRLENDQLKQSLFESKSQFDLKLNAQRVQNSRAFVDFMGSSVAPLLQDVYLGAIQKSEDPVAAMEKVAQVMGDNETAIGIKTGRMIRLMSRNLPAKAMSPQEFQGFIMQQAFQHGDPDDQAVLLKAFAVGNLGEPFDEGGGSFAQQLQTVLQRDKAPAAGGAAAAPAVGGPTQPFGRRIESAIKRVQEKRISSRKTVKEFTDASRGTEKEIASLKQAVPLLARIESGDISGAQAERVLRKLSSLQLNEDDLRLLQKRFPKAAELARSQMRRFRTESLRQK